MKKTAQAGSTLPKLHSARLLVRFCFPGSSIRHGLGISMYLPNSGLISRRRSASLRRRDFAARRNRTTARKTSDPRGGRHHAKPFQVQGIRPACVRSCRHEPRISEYPQCTRSIVTQVAQSLQRRWPPKKPAGHILSNSLNLPFIPCSFGFPAL